MGQLLFARVWDRDRIYRCLTRATQLPPGAVVHEWYNDYAIFLSTYAKEITNECEEDSFFVLCATYTGFILPYERLKMWLTDHHQDTTLAEEIFTGLIAEVTQQETLESDQEFTNGNDAPRNLTEDMQRRKLPNNTNAHGNSTTNANKSSHSSQTPKRGLSPFDIKRLIDTTLYFLDRDTMFSMV